MDCMDWDDKAGVLYVHTGAKAGFGRQTASPNKANMGSFACLLIGIVTTFPSLARS